MATPTALGERNVSSSHTLAEAPPALRAAVIGTTQREAGPSYALDLVDDGEGERAYETEIGTTQRVARFNKNGAALTLGGDDVELGLGLERAGCTGATRAVGEAEPDAVQNRASYQRSLEGERSAYPASAPTGFAAMVRAPAARTIARPAASPPALRSTARAPGPAATPAATATRVPSPTRA